MNILLTGAVWEHRLQYLAGTDTTGAYGALLRCTNEEKREMRTAARADIRIRDDMG